MNKATINRRLAQLEKQHETQDLPPYLIIEDGEPVPEGVKCYGPDANPDLWDEIPEGKKQNDQNS